MSHPDRLRVESADQPLALGGRVVEFSVPDRRVAADDEGMIALTDHDDLCSPGVTRRGQKANPGKQFELAVDRNILHSGGIDPLGNGVVALAPSIVQFLPLNVDRPAGEEMIAAAMVEVQVGVHDDVDAVEVERLFVNVCRVSTR